MRSIQATTAHVPQRSPSAETCDQLFSRHPEPTHTRYTHMPRKGQFRTRSETGGQLNCPEAEPDQSTGFRDFPMPVGNTMAACPPKASESLYSVVAITLRQRQRNSGVDSGFRQKESVNSALDSRYGDSLVHIHERRRETRRRLLVLC